MTVLLTTQYLEEADHLADHVAVLDHGRIVARGTPAQLKAEAPGGHVELRFADDRALGAAAFVEPLAVVDPAALTLRVPTREVDAVRALLDRLDAAGARPEALTTHTPNLDDVFLALTGRPAVPATDDPPARKVSSP